MDIKETHQARGKDIWRQLSTTTKPQKRSLYNEGCITLGSLSNIIGTVIFLLQEIIMQENKQLLKIFVK